MSEWIDPDDAPLLTREFFHRGELRVGGKVIRAATGTLTRDTLPDPDTLPEDVTLRLDPDVIASFRAGGPGWRGRMSEALRKAAGLA